MTSDERAAMQRHVGDWTALLERGTAIVLGPVADPVGPWGRGVGRLRGDQSVTDSIDADPAIQAGIGLPCEVLPMLAAVARPGT